jgi:hypothetical protein
MPLANRAPIIVSFAVLALILVLLGGGGRVIAQDTATPQAEAVPTELPPPVRTFVEAEGVITELPAESSAISMSTVLIAPQVSLRAIVSNGPLLILVDSGTLTIDADSSIIGPPPVTGFDSLRPAATPSASQAVDQLVEDGTQIMIPANTRFQLRNTTDEEVELRIVSLSPEGQDRIGRPAE